MKQCPNCKTTYTDDSLQFCLADGANLVHVGGGDAPTVEMSFDKRNAPVRVNIPPDSAPTVFAAPPPTVSNQTVSANQPSKKGLGLVFAGLFGVLLVLFGGAAAAYFLLPGLVSQQNSSINSAAPSPTAAPQVSPTVAAMDDETERLKREMANLKKQLEEQQKNPRVPNANAAPNGSSAKPPRAGYANSPSDGFLALRSEPSSEAGERVAKIPHNAPLIVFDCPRPSNVGKMPGRWCRVLYEGQTGWAFDGFIRY